MKNLRALTTGLIVWIMIFLTFTIMSMIPVVNESELQQSMILYIMLIPIMMVAMRFHHKKPSNLGGLGIGLIVIAVCLTLDAVITIPLVILPAGGSYLEFFTSPFLWITGAEIMLASILLTHNHVSKTQTV